VNGENQTRNNNIQSLSHRPLMVNVKEKASEK
jgi:hypothetical protein